MNAALAIEEEDDPQVLARDPAALPDALPRGAEIPEDLDPLADGILMAHQVDWIADKSNLKCAAKGRRTGITFAEAQDDTLIAAAARKAGGDNVFYIGDTKDKGREFIGYVAHFAKMLGQQLVQIEDFMFEDKKLDGTSKFISAFRIRFASGFRVEALSSRPENIRGLQGVVVIDEAAFHQDVHGVLDAVNALLIWGGKIRVISTHNGVLSPFNELVREITAGKRPFSLHTIPFSTAVANGLYKRVCLIKGTTWSQEAEEAWEAQIRASYGPRLAAMRQELDAIPADAEGTALTRVQIEAAMKRKGDIVRLVKDDDFRNAPQHVRQADIADWCEKHLAPVLKKFKPFHRHVFGGDFGRSGDLSVFPFYEIGQDLVRRTVLQLELRNVPFETQRDILFYVLDRVPKLAAGALDARGNGQYLAEVAAQRYGEKITEVMLSQAWYRENSTPFTDAVTSGDVELIKDDDTVRDLQGLQYVNGIIKVPDEHSTKGADGFNRHGDAAIGHVLAWFASRQNHAEYGYTSGRPDEDLDDDRTGRSGRRQSSFSIPSVQGGLW